ncbi:disheveled-associated activator of morphogenesis 1-like [Schistocerca gregaria]|uniref:disheveled-associated activator of morphogenesis 1-like n=1 Tax=Schistocerca gregaria TaxID=7010 RepID=UPI00211E98F7|nr:disheveled-associated activator of morphogenesis 1-like [Schistocerca gregaria]
MERKLEMAQLLQELVNSIGDARVRMDEWQETVHHALHGQLQFPTVDADDEVRSRTRQLDALKTALRTLRTQPHSFVLRFVELDGLPALLSFLGGMDYQTAQSSVHTSLIGCVKALMNNLEHIVTKSVTAMFDLLRRKLSHKAAYPHLLSLLHLCILLSLDYGSHPQHWLLFERIVQQLVLQGENSNNPDVAPLQINVKELVHLLAKEEELVAARNRADELEKENANLASWLAKKEQELDLRLQEKEDMETNLQRVKERLEKEMAAHLEMKQRCLELEDRACELDRQVVSKRGQRHRLEQLVSLRSLPDDAKNEGSVEDLSKLGKNCTKVISVIDGRRAQNCTILLSKLKMSDEEISRAILSMDSRDQLPIDMVEQLLKFTPSAEEAALLEEHAEEIDSLARADRFLYEISKVSIETKPIGHYEQQLRSLHYKKCFTTSVCELEPRVRAVLEASRKVVWSRRLRRLLDVVLALGNYMNRGARGNARGFRLASLNRLDTRSSAARGTTLLHYLVEVLDKKFNEILKLDEDIPHVREAAKVRNNQDIGMINEDEKNTVEEAIVTHWFFQTTMTEKLHVPVMSEFLSSATCRFSELEDLFQDMKTRFDRAVRLFGEDNAVSVQPDEFFGIFDAFLNAFNEAHQYNNNLRRRREEEERRAIQEAEDLHGCPVKSIQSQERKLGST